MGALKIDRLLNNSFFDGITKRQIEALDMDKFTHKRFLKGETIIEQDTPGNEMFLIFDGIVRIYRATHIKDVELAIRSVGEYVGEMALFDGNLRSANVSAVTDVDVYVINTETFLFLLNKFESVKNNLILTITFAIRESGLKFSNESISHKELLSYKEIELVRVKDLLDQAVELKRGIDEQRAELELINRELERKNKELYRLTIIDDLTNVYSRAHFNKVLEKEFSRAKRHSINLSILVIDIDHFKRFNDTYGHIVGDIVLKSTAEKISEVIRKEDVVGRIGGEEFAVILPHMELNQAYAVAGKIRDSVMENQIMVEGQRISVTVSTGVTDSLSSITADATGLIHQADLALYKAKKMGRNRVEVYTEGLSMAVINT